MFSESEIQEAAVKARDNMQKHMLVTFTKNEPANSITRTGVPNLQKNYQKFLDMLRMQ